MTFNIVVYVLFSLVAMTAYFKNFWNKDTNGQDIMVYLLIHFMMCLIFIKVFGI